VVAKAAPIAPPPPVSVTPTAPPITPSVPIPAPAPAPPPEPVPIISEPIRAPKLDPSLASLKPKPPEAKPLENAFTLTLGELASHWSEKKELQALQSHIVDIPFGTLESALKTGKLVFPWREMRPWLRASGTAAPSLPEDLMIELPLAVVAPKFIQQRVAAKPQKRVQVGDDIPDLFAQKAQAPAGPIPAAPLAAPVPAPSAGRPALDFGEIFAQPEKKSWTLAEVTQKCASLRGVAGAIIATSDGLLIAGTWPAGVKSESVAAFIPQMYSRTLQCAKELKLGEPGNFLLFIENVPFQIFKTGPNYFAVLGRAGENLPKAQLTALSARLALTDN
jgi:predicted regulator of Ras-like GTPase activity (Roadblock/LC7/MglB family)